MYYIASKAVVYNIEAHTQRFYTLHDDDILSMAVHPNRTIVATGDGGKKPKICVWDSDTMQTLKIIKDFHERGMIDTRCLLLLLTPCETSGQGYIRSCSRPLGSGLSRSAWT